MKALRVMGLLLVLIGCKSVDDILVRSLNDEAKSKIAAIDMLFLEFKTTKDVTLLGKAEVQTADLEKESRNNRFFEAKVIALKCQSSLLKNDLGSVNVLIPEIEKRNPHEERLFMIRADLEKDAAKKEAIIRQGIEKADENNILKLYLADLYFVEGKFRESTAMFDDAFVNLVDDYKLYYKKRRDLAFYFMDHPPGNIKSVSYLLEDEISVENLIRVTMSELKESRNFLDIKSDSIKDIFEYLKTADYFPAGNGLKLADRIKRKDIAYFTLRLISKMEKDEGLLKKYHKIREYRDSSIETDLSPVPDVKMSDYFYTAVLVLVEREIMDLPDGKNFFPDRTISGLDYLDMLKKLMKLY
jgi:hypothetical protein